MDKATFETTDEHVDGLAEVIDGALQSPKLAELRGCLVELSKALGSRYGVELDCRLEICDRQEERFLTVLRTGLSTSNGEAPFRTWGDSSPHKYVVDGEIQVVPHDHCPKCWGEWDFKFQNPSCSDCGATLGENVKLLLDTDTCPYCDEGKVSMASPRCDNCGFDADPSVIAWG